MNLRMPHGMSFWRIGCNAIRMGGRLALACLVLIGAGICLLFHIFPFPEHLVAEAEKVESAQILDGEGGLIAWRVDGDGMWRLPVPLESVSPWVVHATVAAEDKRFWEHGGVDPCAVGRAVSQNIRFGRRVSGASTLTMQTIRLLRPRDRTWSAKCIESFRALQLERLHGKAAVMRLYLNLAPYGGNVIGIEAAARRYFAKSAKELTLGEAALLAGIPQSPARFDPRRHLDAALARREYVLHRMGELGFVSTEDLAAALREPIGLTPTPVRTEAPRLADFVLQRIGPNAGIVRTTLSPNVQAITRAVAAEYGTRFRTQGIEGLAIVVIDVNASSLAAMVGHAFPDDPEHGWINAAAVRRQPGSLLKPFIFGIAYERGLLTPRSVVYDVPTRWAAYSPENMDRDYLGPLPSAKALRLSRNLPAVRLLARLGVESLAERMTRMEMPPEGPLDRYGLSLALGTAETTLLKITNGYAALARLGQYTSLRVLQDKAGGELARMLTPGAAWLTLRSLDAQESKADPRVVWKTGTSWNQRDAWAVCMTPRVTVGVWCGNMSGRGHGGLIGAKAALPVALDLVSRLERADAPGWPCPTGVAMRQVCALSGAPCGRACPHAVEDAFLPGVSSERSCTVHRIERMGGDTRRTVAWPEPVAACLSERNESTQADSR